MDNTEMIRQIRERFKKRMSSDKRMAELQQKLEEGTATLVDTDVYAGQIAECYNMALHEVLGNAGIEEYRQAADAVIPKGFHQITDWVNDYTMGIINRQLQEAEVGMRAVPGDYDYRKEQDVVEKIQQAAGNAEEVSQIEPEASRQIESFSQKAATNAMQKNAKAQNDAGLEIRVTRIYDGIGVHMRKDPCEWCLSRCGENMPYSEAYSKGAFERHPGCHCEIFYKPKRGGWQRQSNWRSNTWEESKDPQMLKMRRGYGTVYRPSNDKRLLKLAIDGNTFVVKSEDLYENSKKIKPIDNFTDIVGHGDPYSMVFRDANGRESNVSAVEFGNILEKAGFYRGGNIRLIACNTGQEPAVVAHYLADKYGVLVMAPTEAVHVDFDGNMILADDDIDAKMGIETGSWRIIKPRSK